MDKLSLQDRKDFPLTTNSLAFMQAAYAALEKLGYIGGDNYIVSGCTVTGSSAAPGYVFLKGILMPFKGGSVASTVQIVKTVTQINVDAGMREQTSYRAEFGTSTDPANNVPWASIVRTDTIISLMAQMTALGNRLTDAEDDILVNAQDIQGLDDRIANLELDEIPWTALIKSWGGLQGITEARACKIGKVIYVSGIINADYNPGDGTVLFVVPSNFPAFTQTVYFSSGDGNSQENGEMMAVSGTRNIVAGPGVGADTEQYFSVAIPII